jgi:hypothetical protein
LTRFLQMLNELIKSPIITDGFRIDFLCQSYPFFRDKMGFELIFPENNEKNSTLSSLFPICFLISFFSNKTIFELILKKLLFFFEKK